MIAVRNGIERIKGQEEPEEPKRAEQSDGEEGPEPDPTHWADGHDQYFPMTD